MKWEGILPLLATVGGVAAFGSFLPWKRPRDSQPATPGHVQTLADLIEEWYEEGESVMVGR